MPRRLIEEAFPLQKVSEDSKHEKNVNHGHISSLHVWPARRPLAACRAVTIATLLPDPTDAPEKVRAEYARLSGSLMPEKQRAYLCNTLIASLTRWGDENGQANWEAKDQKGRWVNKLRVARELILLAYDGIPPKVLDMFAGGGAIPLEAMRLGCEVTANDYNPVAWFILKCTLDYPQRLAGKRHRLPDLTLAEKPDLKKRDLSDHVRLWGQWIWENARKELTQYYPVIDGKPTVAYLWARTIPCQDPLCGGTIPLLKTLWICKKAEKTLADTPENRNRPDFLRLKETKNQTKVIINAKRALKVCPDRETKRVSLEIFAPQNADDIGRPTKAGSAAICPFCNSRQPGDYIKRCGHNGRLKAQMTAVVYQEEYGKEYRPPTQAEVDASEVPAEALAAIAKDTPYGMPDEVLPSKERHRSVGSQLPDYGFKTWSDLFTNRQLLVLMTVLKWTHAAQVEMEKARYPSEWVEAINGYLACAFGRMLDHSSSLISWILIPEAIGHTFVRYALPMTWDFSEGASANDVRGSYQLCLDKILASMETVGRAHIADTPNCVLLRQSATDPIDLETDAIITDPPYYDAIPYADISDFFYVWLRRSIGDRFPFFANVLTPKQEELVQQHKTGERGRSGKERYEKGMAESFRAAHDALHEDGRIVLVFAHKEPDAWETLVKAMLEAGLVVTASWPIDTEKGNRQSGQGTAALATSLWMVCRKRPKDAKVGYYTIIKREMQERITEKLRYFWDIGIRGPDLVWAAIGPALEIYARHTEVRRIDGRPFTVTEFLTEVRRIVTDFALGFILHGANTEALDEYTRYYLMQREYFGTGTAPAGECILLAQAYGLSIDELRAAKTGFLQKAPSGSGLELLGYADRSSELLGYTHASGEIPMIDKIHRILKLWKAADKARLDAYFHAYGLRENSLFRAVLQALVETSPEDSADRPLLETLMIYDPGVLRRSVSFPGRSAEKKEGQLTFDEDMSS